ncbi:hypothetical protein PLICRDRAFT_517817 [Plicaturopsis crispa FD-325 SS-3]|nr:hypothetical protein PLICRDRAFT_517817 [Plicaturopsis crispa FD-325 SS-3]
MIAYRHRLLSFAVALLGVGSLSVAKLTLWASDVVKSNRKLIVFLLQKAWRVLCKRSSFFIPSHTRSPVGGLWPLKNPPGSRICAVSLHSKVPTHSHS